MAVCCMHAKVSYAYRAGFPLVKPPLGCLVHSHVSYCCWLSAVCVFVCVCVCLCVCVCVCKGESWLGSQSFVEPPVGCVPGELVVKVVCCVHVKLNYRVWFALVEPPLGCLPHSLMSYCWWLLAVCVCPKVMFVRVCVSKDEAGFTMICGISCWMSTRFTGELLLMVVCCLHAKLSYRVWFTLVEPSHGHLPYSQVSYC